VGRRLAEIFVAAGLEDVHLRLADGVYQLIPPYDSSDPDSYAHWLLEHYAMEPGEPTVEPWIAAHPDAARLQGYARALHEEKLAQNASKGPAIARGELVLTSCSQLYVAVGRKPR
jgi:hypothetical protein